MLGLCLTSLGDIDDGVAAYRRSTELAPQLKDSWTNMALALKEASRVREAEEAFARVMTLDRPGSTRWGQGRRAAGGCCCRMLLRVQVLVAVRRGCPQQLLRALPSICLL
jgi:hypothetical protein